MLQTIFVIMFYCSGMPSLLPCALFALVITFFLDKSMMLRVYSTQGIDSLDGSLALKSATLLKMALIAHLAIGTWMLGNDQVRVPGTNGWTLVTPAGRTVLRASCLSRSKAAGRRHRPVFGG